MIGVLISLGFLTWSHRYRESRIIPLAKQEGSSNFAQPFVAYTSFISILWLMFDPLLLLHMHTEGVPRPVMSLLQPCHLVTGNWNGGGSPAYIP